MYYRLRMNKDNKTKDAMQRDCVWAADEIDRLRALLREAFTAGMLVGHHRTVEGTMPSDADGRTDEADCWMHENGIVTFVTPNAQANGR